MKYKEYLKNTILGDYFDTITDEVDYNLQGNTLVIKKLTGTIMATSKLIPIQLIAHTDDVNGVFNLLTEFSVTHANVSFRDGLEYVKQDYGTPMTMQNFFSAGHEYMHLVIVTGTLLVSDNISEIKSIKIDGEEVAFSNATINYVAIADTQKFINQPLSKSVIRNGHNRLQVDMLHRATGLTQKIRNVRRGQITANTTFEIEVQFYENDLIEKYTMSMDSFALTSSSVTMPIAVVSFVE